MIVILQSTGAFLQKTTGAGRYLKFDLVAWGDLGRRSADGRPVQPWTGGGPGLWSTVDRAKGSNSSI
jgi:hypothetical protein